MLIRRPPLWEKIAGQETPEELFTSRRRFMQGSLAGVVGLGISGVTLKSDPALAIADDLYPAKRNDAFQIDRPLTEEKYNLSYNNFYEFGSSKTEPQKQAQALELTPWPVTIDGMVEKPITLDADELIRRMPLEERLYRHRCVEAWAMTIPWTGFRLADLLALAKPLSGARYVRMETFHNPDVARGQRATWYPWPYVEGLTLDEAANDLAFIATGAYGKPLARQMGAPLRLAVPWKYGFKSIKSIVKFTLTDERPRTFWEISGPGEYGFWANVNPEVPHARWSQAEERFLGSDTRYPTQKFNGYGEMVADLYKDYQGEDLYH